MDTYPMIIPNFQRDLKNTKIVQVGNIVLDCVDMKTEKAQVRDMCQYPLSPFSGNESKKISAGEMEY